jgi:hypothetical protein
VPQYIYYVNSLYRGLLRNCCLRAYLGHETLELAAACVCACVCVTVFVCVCVCGVCRCVQMIYIKSKASTTC